MARKRSRTKTCYCSRDNARPATEVIGEHIRGDTDESLPWGMVLLVKSAKLSPTAKGEISAVVDRNGSGASAIQAAAGPTVADAPFAQPRLKATAAATVAFLTLISLLPQSWRRFPARAVRKLIPLRHPLGHIH